MKDVELRNIIRRVPFPLTKLSLYANGRWQFGNFNSTFIQSDGQSIYRIAVKFSLVPQNVNDPKGGLLFGEPGDYVGMDRTGVLSLITKEQYDYRFPKKREPFYPPDTSEKLKDPNYITRIVRGSAPAGSNTRTRTTYTPSTSRTSGGSSGGTYGGSPGRSSGGSSGGGGGGGY